MKSVLNYYIHELKMLCDQLKNSFQCVTEVKVSIMSTEYYQDLL